LYKNNTIPWVILKGTEPEKSGFAKRFAQLRNSFPGENAALDMQRRGRRLRIKALLQRRHGHPTRPTGNVSHGALHGGVDCA